MARTKIVATLGPASSEIKIMKRLVRLGVDVFRVNFSHGDETSHAKIIANARKASGKKPIAILGDLAGPKLRCGIFPEPVFLKKGAGFTLTTKNINGTSEGCSVNYKRLPEEVHSGEHIFLDDGNITLRVEKTKEKEVMCTVLNGGRLSSHKGINLPHTILSIPALTARDRKMIRFGVEQGVDFFALSFVKNARDIRMTRKAIKACGANIPIIAKIEKHEAITNLNEIIEAADGAMVARGDLGIEIPLQDVPLAQKRIIALCNEKGKPVITATQMLESMIEHPRPTRAEVTDIANAILDGTDAVMLSGETAVGKYPGQAVEIMNTVAGSIEESLEFSEDLAKRKMTEKNSVPGAISLATCTISHNLKARTILCCSATGYTARFVSRHRPQCSILVFTLNPETQRRLNLSWGIIPFVMNRVEGSSDIQSFDKVVHEAVRCAIKSGEIKKGDRVIVTAGLPLGIGGTTNMLRVMDV